MAIIRNGSRFRHDCAKTNIAFVVSQPKESGGAEYTKAKLYNDIINFEDCFSKMTNEAKSYFLSYLTSDLRMCISGDPNEHSLQILEAGADLIRYFANDEVLLLLIEITERGWNNANCYAVRSLLTHNRQVPNAVISSLAEDLQYADMTFTFLKQFKKDNLFPAQYTSVEYLAKSDMVHWLCFPTELGKKPTEIEYIGKVKYFWRKEIYYVFRFRSDSDTLSDDIKNEWLIGWSSENGRTFSNFDLYTAYEKKTPAATLRNIKKQLIG